VPLFEERPGSGAPISVGFRLAWEDPLWLKLRAPQTQPAPSVLVELGAGGSLAALNDQRWEPGMPERVEEVLREGGEAGSELHLRVHSGTPAEAWWAYVRRGKEAGFKDFQVSYPSSFEERPPRPPVDREAIARERKRNKDRDALFVLVAWPLLLPLFLASFVLQALWESPHTWQLWRWLTPEGSLRLRAANRALLLARCPQARVPKGSELRAWLGRRWAAILVREVDPEGLRWLAERGPIEGARLSRLRLAAMAGGLRRLEFWESTRERSGPALICFYSSTGGLLDESTSFWIGS